MVFLSVNCSEVETFQPNELGFVSEITISLVLRTNITERIGKMSPQ